MIPGRQTGTRCIGVVIYPDGSQAEIWDTEQSHLSFRPIKPRRLTMAPFGLFSLLCLIAFSLSGCVHLQRVGDKPICLLDYDSGIKHCVYDDWKACHNDLRRNTICYKR